MMPVRLETWANGPLEAGQFVGNTRIPPFNPLPDVLVWGDRTFKLASHDSTGAIYRECFTFWIVEEVTE